MEFSSFAAWKKPPCRSLPPNMPNWIYPFVMDVASRNCMLYRDLNGIVFEPAKPCTKVPKTPFLSITTRFPKTYSCPATPFRTNCASGYLLSFGFVTSLSLGSAISDFATWLQTSFFSVAVDVVFEYFSSNSVSVIIKYRMPSMTPRSVGMRVHENKM